MSRPPRVARLLVIALALGALPLKSGACGGRTACFTVTAAELGGGQACPGVGEASTRLLNTMCPGSVESVDGPGSLDGDLCCYPVTYGPLPGDSICGVTFPTTSGDFPTGTSASSASSGTAIGFDGGPTGPCVSCNAALNGAPFGQVCDPTPLSKLRVCACAANCTDACDPTLCAGNAPDNGCLACVQASCASELAACRAE